MNRPLAWTREGGGWSPGDAVPLSDRGVRFGMAVFETVGVRDGRPMLWEEHSALLRATARRLLAAEPPAELQPPPLGTDATGMLRVYFSAGDGAPAAPVDTPRLFAFFEPLTGTARPGFQTAVLLPAQAPSFGAGAKTANYWGRCAAQSEALQLGADHAILADERGRILSAAFGNVFFVRDGALFTPDAAALPVRTGVIRNWIMERMDVQEAQWTAEELSGASEIFVTNSRLGAMPLRCDGIEPGPVGGSLRGLILREELVP